ncbi:MAG: sugar ABC transporter permease [Chloroflexota bacterium]
MAILETSSKTPQSKSFISAKKLRDSGVAYLFLLPFLLLYGLFTLYPIFQSLWISLHNWEIVGTNIQFIGMRNYTRLMDDPLFWASLWHTLGFVVLTIPIIGLGLIFALILNRNVSGIGVFRTLYYVPNVLSVAVIGLIWARIFASTEAGLINAILMRFEIEPIPWLHDTALAMPAVAIATTWWTVGFPALVLLAGLQGINEELYDAAKVDGANVMQRFRFITVPGLRRTLAFVSILQVIASFQIFGQVDLMTGGGPAGSTRTIVYYIWERGFSYWQLGYGAAMAFILFIILLILSIFQLWLFRDNEG